MQLFCCKVVQGLHKNNFFLNSIKQAHAQTQQVPRFEYGRLISSLLTHDQTSYLHTCSAWPHMTLCDGTSLLTIIYLKLHQ